MKLFPILIWNFICILLISVYVLVSFFIFFSKCHYKYKNLTNTSKLPHRNEQNTSKISKFWREKFHTPHALSLYIFNYASKEQTPQLSSKYLPTQTKIKFIQKIHLNDPCGSNIWKTILGFLEFQSSKMFKLRDRP
jgi:hypothetical protein